MEWKPGGGLGRSGDFSVSARTRMSVAVGRLSGALAASEEGRMRTRGIPTTGGTHGPAVRIGLWRAAAAAPAMLGSLLLVSVTVGGLDPWAGPILPTWVGCG